MPNMGTVFGVNSSMIGRLGLGKDPNKYIKTTDLKALDGNPNNEVDFRKLSHACHCTTGFVSLTLF